MCLNIKCIEMYCISLQLGPSMLNINSGQWGSSDIFLHSASQKQSAGIDLCKLLYLHCFAVFIPMVFPMSVMDSPRWSVVVKPLILNLFPLQKLFFTHSTTHMEFFAQGKNSL